MGLAARVREYGMIGGPAVTMFDVFCSFVGKIARLILIAAFCALAAAVAVGLTGCGSRAHAYVKPETVKVTVVVHVCDATPESRAECDTLLKPRPVQPQTPACTRNGKAELCNDQLLYERNEYRKAHALDEVDKDALRSIRP